MNQLPQTPLGLCQSVGPIPVELSSESNRSATVGGGMGSGFASMYRRQKRCWPLRALGRPPTSVVLVVPRPVASARSTTSLPNVLLVSVGRSRLRYRRAAVEKPNQLSLGEKDSSAASRKTQHRAREGPIAAVVTHVKAQQGSFRTAQGRPSLYRGKVGVWEIVKVDCWWCRRSGRIDAYCGFLTWHGQVQLTPRRAN